MARRLVVDTNVVACYLLKEAPNYRDVQSLLARDYEILAPESWRVELLSVLWQACRRGICSAEDGPELLACAEGLIARGIPVQSLWCEALAVAVNNDSSPCDTLFVVLADREGCPLASFDAVLRREFPAIVRRPSELPA